MEKYTSYCSEYTVTKEQVIKSYCSECTVTKEQVIKSYIEGDDLEYMMAMKEAFILKSLSQIDGFPKLLRAYSTPYDRETNMMPRFNLVMNNVGKPITYSGNIQEARRILADTTNLLCILHHNGIVHCDIKPNNIMTDESGKISVIDFSHSHKLLDTHFRDSDKVVQTKLYTAPESSFYSENKTTKIDIWSLGCVYYELITNQVLMEDCNYSNVINKIYKCEKSEQNLLLRMLQTDKSGRT